MYRIEKSSTRPNGWVLTDLENLVVITFEENRFNETQKVTFLENCPLKGMQPEEMAAQAAKILRKMADWATIHHASLLVEDPHTIEWSEDNEHFYINRNKYPRFRIELIDENINGKELKNALKKCAASLYNNFTYGHRHENRKKSRRD